MSSTREERLRSDLKTLTKLDRVSSVLKLEPDGDPPDSYEILLHGKGIRQSNDADKTIQVVSLHRIEIRLPFSYPTSPPNIRWLTPIFHPNVSFGGFIELDEIGLPWSEDIFLDAVCERLWDVARGAYVNMDSATNHNAKAWYAEKRSSGEAFDNRVLRDQGAPERSNIIRYQRRRTDEEIIELKGDVHEDVYFIGDDTKPQMPSRSPQIPRRLNKPGDDIYFIGDD